MSPSRGYTVVAALLLLLSQVYALQANLAGIVDWHQTLIGTPLLVPSPPSFVDTPRGKRIVAITKSNVLAALDADSGSITWRHLLEPDDAVVSYHVHVDYILLLSGPSATTARLFNLTTGHAIWERPLGSPTSARLTNPVHLGTDAFFADTESSVVILSEGRRVTKFRLSDGYEEWAMDAPGVGDNILFKQLFVSDQSVHILAVTNSFASLTLTTMTLDLATSRPLDDFAQIPCILEAPENAHFAASDIPGSVKVLWLEVGRIKSTYIGPGGYVGNTKELLPRHGRFYERIITTGTRRAGLILGQSQNGEVTIIDVRDVAKPVTVWEGTADSAENSPSVYSAAPTENGVVFSRIYWSFKNSWSVIEAMSVSFNGDVLQSGFTYAFDTAEYGVVQAAAISSMPPFEQISTRSEIMPTLMLTTSSGNLQLVHAQGFRWQRDESLADIAAMRFVDLGEPATADARVLLAEEAFAGRLGRHLRSLQHLPGFLVNFAHRLVTSSYSSAQQSTPLVPGKLHRDQFGLQKLVVVATRAGKLVAMDSANGNVIWRRNLGMTTENSTELAVEGMWNVRDVDQVDGALLAVLGTRTRDTVSTVAFHVDALSGEVKGERYPHTGLPTGKTVFGGRCESAFLVPFENCGTRIRVLAVVDEEKKVHIFPSCQKVASQLSAMSSDLTFTATVDSLDGPILTGYSPSASSTETTLSVSVIWSRVPAPGETLVSQIPVVFDNVASIGRPINNKAVLYKYLNPHLVVVASANPAEGYVRVEVVDSTSGENVYSAQVTSFSGDVHTAMVENWLVFAWRSDDGWRLTSVELYDAPKGQTAVSSRERTFLLGYGVKGLGFSTSKFGITAKELIVVNDRRQIATIPRRLLDPRRPSGKPTSADKEEMLIPYDPVIPHEPKRIISHGYQVQGVRQIATSPSLAESTSLLFAYGLDLFLTRGVTPSGTFDILSDSFNKVQILLSVAALSAGIAIAKPAVRRKTLRMRWY